MRVGAAPRPPGSDTRHAHDQATVAPLGPSGGLAVYNISGSANRIIDVIPQ